MITGLSYNSIYRQKKYCNIKIFGRRGLYMREQDLDLLRIKLEEIKKWDGLKISVLEM